MTMLALKNPRTTIPGILVAVAGVLSAVTKDKLTLHDWLALAGTILVAVALVYAKDALPSDPPAPVAPIAVTVSPAPKVPPVVLGLLSALCFALFFTGCSMLAGCAGLTATQKVEAKTAVEVAADTCVGVLIITGNPAEVPFCATAAEFAKATIDLAKSQAGQVGAAALSPADELVALRERCIAIRAGAK